MEECFNTYNDLINATDASIGRIAEAATDKNIEFEIRFRGLNEEQFLRLDKNISGELAVVRELSINAISKSADGVIRSMSFSAADASKISDIFVIKKKVCSKKCPDIDGATINVSTEQITKQSNITAADFRVKIRNSYVDTSKLFRWDLTIVFAGSDKLAQQLGFIKENLFNNDDFATIIGRIKSEEKLKFLNSYMKFETEIEYLGKNIKKDFNDVKAAGLKHFQNEKGESNNNMSLLVNIAVLMGHTAGSINNFKFGRSNFKALGNNAIVLDKRTYKEELWPPFGLLATDKADGTRTIVYFDSRYAADTIYAVSAVGIKEFKFKNDSGIKSFVLDTEEINGEYFCFDAANFNAAGINIDYKSGLKERINAIPAGLGIIGDAIKLSAKKYVKLGPELTNLEEQFKNIEGGANKKYETDGIIISEVEKSYLETRNFKWKPWEKNSIDFLVLDLPEKFRGTTPFIDVPGRKCYLLFVTISEKDRNDFNLTLPSFYKNLNLEVSNIIPINFQCPYNPYAYIYYVDNKVGNLSGKIVELVFKRPALEDYLIAWEKIGKNKKGAADHDPYLDISPLPLISNTDNIAPQIIEWEFVKIREDRSGEKNYYGNYFTVAVATYTNYVAEFDIENLWNLSAGYFQKNAETIYKAANGFKRYVISELLKEFIAIKTDSTILDLAGGRGADLGRYIASNISNVILADIDSDALQEANMRYMEIVKNFKNFKPMNLKTIHCDLRGENVVKIINNTIPAESADNIICNFALHYFCNNDETLIRFAQLCRYFIKPGGHLLFTVMNGCLIWKKLVKIAATIEKENASIDFIEKTPGPFTKYKIVKKFKVIKSNFAVLGPQSTGDMIEVKLPFSDQLYEEPLCNIKYVLHIFERAGFKRVKSGSFDSKLSDFAAVNKDMHNKLSDIDKEYISLHEFLVLKHNIKK